MNPFDLSGPAFLALYLAVAAGAVLIAAWLRWQLRQSGGASDLDPSDLSAYHLAYLAGGKERAVRAALAALVQGGALTVDSGRWTVSAQRRPAAEEPLERELYACVAAADGCPLTDLCRHGDEALAGIREEIEQAGLTLTAGQARVARWWPLLLMLGVAGLGSIKILVGLARHKPVFFLVLLVAATAGGALVGFGRRPFRSRRGDQLLRRARAEQAALQTTAQRQPEALAPADLSCAVALFGLEGLGGSRFADMRAGLRGGKDGGGGCGFASCGGGGCGGGGCGGGCGGCGA
jgi:uncharacterized protein (TIGR04222 family)